MLTLHTDYLTTIEKCIQVGIKTNGVGGAYLLLFSDWPIVTSLVRPLSQEIDHITFGRRR